MSHVACRNCRMSHVMSNAYVDPWNMPNNFCFHVYAQTLNSKLTGEGDTVKKNIDIFNYKQ